MVHYCFSQIHGADVAKLFMQSVVYRLASAPESSHPVADETGESGRAHHCLGRPAGHKSDAYQPPQPTLNDSRDEEGKEAPDRSAGDTEGDGASC